MSLLNKYKKMKLSDKQKLIELIYEDLKQFEDLKKKIEKYMEKPKLKKDLPEVNLKNDYFFSSAE